MTRDAVGGYEAGRDMAPNGNSTADRALGILFSFDMKHTLLSAPQIADRMGMSRSTVYRYLNSLRSYGLIEEEQSTGKYRLGARIFELALLARKGLGLREIALPVMRALSVLTGETVILTRRSGDSAVCLEQVQSSSPIRLRYEVGQLVALHAAASAKVLLAHTDEKELDRLLSRPLRRFTEHTVTDPGVLRKELERIRVEGYSVNYGEVDAGVRGVAAPVLLSDGSLAGGLAVVGPEQRMPDLALPAIIEAVRSSANLLASRLDAVN